MSIAKPSIVPAWVDEVRHLEQKMLDTARQDTLTRQLKSRQLGAVDISDDTLNAVSLRGGIDKPTYSRDRRRQLLLTCT